MNGPNVTRGIILAVSCLVLGFVGGWSLANLGGKTIALPDANLDVTVAKPNPVTTAAEGQTATAAVDPKTASILVLNASGISGRASETQKLLTGRGYGSVAIGNAAQVTGNTIYYVDTAKGAAEEVASELQIPATEPLAGTPIASAAGGAQVVVILGK